MSKKRSKLKIVLGTFLGCVAGVFTTNLVGSVVLSKKANEKMKANPDCNNMLYSVALNSADITIQPDTDYAYLNCLTGCMNITLSEIPVKEDLHIVFSTVMSAINVNLPQGVKVSIEGEGQSNAVNNAVPNNEDAGATVHIDLAGTKLSAFNFQLGEGV